MSSMSVIKSAGVVISMVSLLNTLTVNDFQIKYSGSLRKAHDAFLWRSISNDSLHSRDTSLQPSFGNTVVIFLYTISYSIRGLKDMFAEGFFMVGIVSLWLISLDFRASVRLEMISSPKTTRMRDMDTVRKHELIQLYLKVCTLSRLYSHAHGHALLCYLANYLLYYSTKIDTLFLPGTIGAKFYEIEYLCTFGLVYGLGASFSSQVKNNFYTSQHRKILNY